MTSTYESIMDAALRLSPDDRCRVATSLWESTGSPVPETEADELESLLHQREAEMDFDPGQEIGSEAFMAHFAIRRRA